MPIFGAHSGKDVTRGSSVRHVKAIGSNVHRRYTGRGRARARLVVDSNLWWCELMVLRK